MGIKEFYYYIFYKFYKLFNSFKTTRWLMDWKAAIVITVLEIWILFPIINYYDFFSGKRIELTFFSPIILIPLVSIVGLKWAMFVFNDDWKLYIKEFDKWPKAKNKKGTWILLGFILLIVVNFIFSFYLNPPSRGLR
jgi:hypothetical protein